MRTLVLTLAVMLAMPLLAEGKPWIGLKLKVVEGEQARKLKIEGGLEVTRVDDKSPAKESGIVVGDVVLSAGETSVKTIKDMSDVLADMAPGDTLALGVLHKNGRTEPMILTVGDVADKNDKYADDARIQELKRELRELDSERRRVREELDRRIEQLEKGQANKVKPQPENKPPEEKPDNKPIEKDPKPTKVKVKLGAKCVSLSPAEAKNLGVKGGVRVSSVKDASPAASGGLKADDVIISADKTDIAGTGGLRAFLAGCEADQKVEFTVIRGGKRVKVSVTLKGK